MVHKEMIPDFKTYIKESIWSDLQDRSSGEVLRKEDDINLMDMEEFYEYTQEKYSDARFYIDIHYHEFISVDEIPVHGRAKQLLLVFDWTEPENKQITLPYSFRDNFENVFNKLTEKFSLEYPEAKDDDEYDDFSHNEFIYIHPKDGKKITNRFYIEVLDYIIKAANGNLTESIWSDLQDRSSGEVTRKEDDVNLMDKDKFCEYLKSQYKIIVECKDPIGCGNSYIRLPLFVYPRTVRYILLYPKYNRIMVRTPYIEVWPDNLLSIIDHKYKREDVIDVNRDHMTYITPKEGEGDNKFFLDFIETILANVDKPAIKKKSLNESIWSDLQDRGSGEVTRKEDMLKGIYDYLCSKYQVVYVNEDEIEYRDDYIIFSVYKTMNTHATISINNNKIVFSSMYPDRYKGQMKKYLNTFKDELYAFYDKIKKTYSPEIEYYDGYDHWIDFEITPKGGMTKEFCAEFIDFVLDNMPEENKHIVQLLWKK